MVPLAVDFSALLRNGLEAVLPSHEGSLPGAGAGDGNVGRAARLRGPSGRLHHQPPRRRWRQCGSCGRELG